MRLPYELVWDYRRHRHCYTIRSGNKDARTCPFVPRHRRLLESVFFILFSYYFIRLNITQLICIHPPRTMSIC